MGTVSSKLPRIMDSIEDSRVSTDFYKKLADEHFGETEDNRIGKILEFRTLLQNDSPELLVDIPGPEDKFLLKFLRAGNFDVIASVQVLKNYISLITTGPQVSLPYISTYPKEQF